MTSPTSDADSKLSAPIDLGRVRSLFARPDRLAEAEFLRREIAARMQERLALVKISPRHILDAGCGIGADLLPLQKRFPSAQVLGIDAAAAMASAARTSQAAARSSLDKLVAQWLPVRSSGAALVCGDFARLPLPVKAVDLVWSNLAVHWHPAPDKVFAEWRRVLRVDGLLMFSCFGPDTFKELREAFQETDRSPHVLPFVDMHDFGDMLVEAGFSTPVMDMETLTVTYRTVDKLLADVRALGGNPLATRRPTLTGRRRWQQMVDRLEQSRRPDGTIGLTFEVIYGHAFRPAPRKTARGEAIVRFDFPGKQ